MLIVWCTCIVRTTFSNSSFEEVDVGVEGVDANDDDRGESVGDAISMTVSQTGALNSTALKSL